MAMTEELAFDALAPDHPSAVDGYDSPVNGYPPAIARTVSPKSHHPSVYARAGTVRSRPRAASASR
jgi:hypothetical protein